ncbi:MAG: SCP2 sterol-binding domain-containing protein [Myxococcota bacterium]|nr:SCP2 sterol-binding domain-containing protein [Myxococcota bacterium]
MAEFPESPMEAREFMERWLPQAFAEAELPPGSDAVRVRLGVLLEGEGGGEWVCHIEGGRMRVEAGSREDAAFTIVQPVHDWRGALWESRGGAVGQGAAAFFRPGSAPPPGSQGPTGGAPSGRALAEMEKLQGVIRMLVVGEDEGPGEWRVDFKLGTGPIPEEPTTTIRIQAEDAAAMQRGELDPMTAFMTGRMQVEGDMTLMMQMQAIQMQAAQQEAGGGASSGGGSGPTGA